ncbi:unnamed protein product [Lactuca saligna]|uniref:Uncharacterized protein n=1 Tax=Lactuca saligna TaxID=75948 RepID=A0AA35V3B5_LACSI|nr:unnamed protein product [Lactuca saligna]
MHDPISRSLFHPIIFYIPPIAIKHPSPHPTCHHSHPATINQQLIAGDKFIIFSQEYSITIIIATHAPSSLASPSPTPSHLQQATKSPSSGDSKLSDNNNANSRIVGAFTVLLQV